MHRISHLNTFRYNSGEFQGSRNFNPISHKLLPNYFNNAIFLHNKGPANLTLVSTGHISGISSLYFLGTPTLTTSSSHTSFSYLYSLTYLLFSYLRILIKLFISTIAMYLLKKPSFKLYRGANMSIPSNSKQNSITFIQ